MLFYLDTFLFVLQSLLLLNIPCFDNRRSAKKFETVI